MTFRSQGQKICLVTNELDGVVRNSGVGACYGLASERLAHHGWQVHILYLGGVDDQPSLRTAPRRLSELGIQFWFLDQFQAALPAHLRLTRYPHLDAAHSASERARYALQELHGRYNFDLIEFPAWRGFGFDTIRAKRTGLAFEEAAIAVRLQGSSRWRREGDNRWASGVDELKADFREKYCFENANIQISPSRHMIETAIAHGWNVQPQPVIACPYPELICPPRDREDVPDEIVFFGRLERRKGLHYFLDAIELLDPKQPITFLGKDTELPCGQIASEMIRRRLKGRKHRIEAEFDRTQAISYLAGGNGLAVIGSTSEAFGFAVAECALHRIPFIAAQVGGISEIVTDPEIRRQVLFEPNAKSLAHCLARQLEPGVEQESRRSRLADAVEPRSKNERFVNCYSDALARQTPARTFATTASADDPLVTLAVSHYNYGHFLPAALDSLSQQTYRSIEVIVADDGSTDRASVEAFRLAKLHYPRFHFFEQSNAGPAAVRNRCLELAKGEYFLPVDCDNIAMPQMVETLVKAARRNPNCGALTCGYVALSNSAQGQHQYYYLPAGGPHSLSMCENLYGDTNALFRTDLLRSVGGFVDDRSTPFEDWETFIKIHIHGHEVMVVPEPLFYYRLHGDNRSLEMTSSYTAFQPYIRAMIDRHLCHPENASQDDLRQWIELALGFEQSARRADFIAKGRKQRIRKLWRMLALAPHSVASSLHSFASSLPRVARLASQKSAFVRGSRAASRARGGEATKIDRSDSDRKPRRGRRAA